jgi:hypothetical protein
MSVLTVGFIFTVYPARLRFRSEVSRRGHESHDLTRFFKVETRAAGIELGPIAVAEVAEEV